MTGWSCSASLCFNSHRKPGVWYYRLPRDPVIQQQYKKILKTDRVNWFRGYICAEHWSTGEKIDNQLPDIAAPPSQIPLFEKKLENVKKRIRRSSNPSVNDKNRLKELQKNRQPLNLLMPLLFLHLLFHLLHPYQGKDQLLLLLLLLTNTLLPHPCQQHLPE